MFIKKVFLYLSITFSSPSTESLSEMRLMSAFFPNPPNNFGTRFLVLPTAPVSIFLLSSQSSSLHHCFQFWEEEKIGGGSRPVNTVVVAWLWFFCWPKTKHRCGNWCVIMVRDQWSVFPQICESLTNDLAESEHNFNVVFFIARTTLWQEFTIHNSLAIEEKCKQNRNIWSNLLFSVLALPDVSIRMNGFWLQRHSHKLIIFHQLWPFWVNMDHRWTSSTSPERYSCNVVFAQNWAICGTIFTAAYFMHKTSVKVLNMSRTNANIIRAM